MKKPIITAICLLIVVLLGALIAIPYFGSIAGPSYGAQTQSKARKCVFSVREYLKAHGELPAELPFDSEMVGVQVIETKTQRAFEWLYYGGDYRGQPDDEFILVAAPLLFKGNKLSSKFEDGDRIVAYLDAHTESMPEDEFQAAIQRQRALATETASPTKPADR